MSEEQGEQLVMLQDAATLQQGKLDQIGLEAAFCDVAALKAAAEARARERQAIEEAAELRGAHPAASPK